MRSVFHLSVLLFMSIVSFVRMQAWDVFTSGNDVIVRVGDGLSGRQCCRGASIDDPTGGGAQCSQSCPANSEVTVTLPCNSVGTHTVYAYWSDDHTNGYVTETRTVDVTIPPAPTCPLYDFYGGGSQVLTHKYETVDAYPGGQTADAQVTLKLKARRAPGGTTIYLRVDDPPDTSPPNTAAYRKPQPHPSDDNDDPSPTDGTISGSTMSTVSLPAAGLVTVNVKVTDQYAGDNYEIWASPDSGLHNDPNFVCNASTNCLKTPVITAWKRAYLEHDRMFRHGTYLTQDAAPCATGPCYLNLASLRGLHRQDRLRIIHAPRFGVPGSFYNEDVEIVRVQNNRDRVEVTPFNQSYFGPDTDGLGVIQPFLADAVGVITGVDDADYYTANTTNITPLFDSSFVEYLSITEDPSPFLPFEENVSGSGASQSDEVRAISRKWFYSYGKDNHHHLLAGSAAAPGLLA
jgi:hypothetical protein